MATTIVELSGDEAGLLRSLQRVIDKEREHERQLGALSGAGDQAGQGLEAALDRVRKAEDQTLKSLMGDLRKLGPEGQAAAQALTGHFSDTGRAGLKNFESVIEQIQKIDPAAAEVLGAVQAQFAEASEAANFDRSLDSLKRLGPEGAAMAKGIAEDLAQASSSSAASLDTVVAEIIRMRPEAAESAARIQSELAEAARVSEFHGTLDSLKALGPEGAAIAKGIQEDMQKASAASAAGLDDVLAKIKEMDPAAAASADRVRTELAEAARFTEGRFASTLDELRKIGPVGKQVADQMRQHLVAAGEISERSIGDVIEKIRQIDPAAAEAAEKMHQKIEAANQKGTTSFDNFANGAIGNIMAIAGSYFSIQKAIDLVNENLRVQERLIKSAYDRQLDLAKAQQDAAKNFAGMTAFEQSGMLKSVPFKIAREAQFSDVPAIQAALGNAVSAGATFDDAEAAVLAAAKVNRLTPEKLSASASAAIDLGKATGSRDIYGDLALLTTTGSQARIEDPLALASSLAPALNNIVNTVPDQDKDEAKREGAGLFAALTQFATDKDGKRSMTAATQFTGELGKFFADLEKQQREARSKAELLDRKIAKGSDTEKDRFEREQIKQFLAQSQGLKDPGTLSGRIQTLQNNEGIHSQFYSRDFGEQQFKGAFAQIGDAESKVAKGMEASLKVISNDAAGFERLVGTLDRGTPQLVMANAVERIKSIGAVRDVENTEGAMLNFVRETAAGSLEKNRPSGIVAGPLASLGETGIARGSLEGSTAAEEAVSAIHQLMLRQFAVIATENTEEGIRKANELSEVIETLTNTLLLQSGELGSGSLQAAAQRAENLSGGFGFGAESRDQRVVSAEFFTKLAEELRRATASAQSPEAAAPLLSPEVRVDPERSMTPLLSPEPAPDRPTENRPPTVVVEASPPAFTTPLLSPETVADAPTGNRTPTVVVDASPPALAAPLLSPETVADSPTENRPPTVVVEASPPALAAPLLSPQAVADARPAEGRTSARIAEPRSGDERASTDPRIGELIAEMKETNRIARETSEATKASAEAAKQTADNTKPKPALPPNYASAQQDAAAFGSDP